MNEHSIYTHCYYCGLSDDERDQCYCNSYDLEHRCEACGDAWSSYGEWDGTECPAIINEALETINSFIAVAIFKIRLRRYLIQKTFLKNHYFPNEINKFIVNWL